MAFNIVELAASVEGDETAFDQRCRFGHRVGGHAVYCHNDDWDDSPRKCRRSWYTNGRIKDEECAGFEPNPDFKGEFVQITPPQLACSRCMGAKRVKTDRGKTETCPLCVGSGEEPKPIPLTSYEQDTLEHGTTHSGRHDTAGHPFIRIAKNEAEQDSIEKLYRLDLVVLRSISIPSDISVYLLENTVKGEAVMRQNWKAAKQ
jgi:hypothetical protein